MACRGSSTMRWARAGRAAPPGGQRGSSPRPRAASSRRSTCRRTLCGPRGPRTPPSRRTSARQRRPSYCRTARGAPHTCGTRSCRRWGGGGPRCCTPRRGGRTPRRARRRSRSRRQLRNTGCAAGTPVLLPACSSTAPHVAAVPGGGVGPGAGVGGGGSLCQQVVVANAACAADRIASRRAAYCAASAALPMRAARSAMRPCAVTACAFIDAHASLHCPAPSMSIPWLRGQSMSGFGVWCTRWSVSEW